MYKNTLITRAPSHARTRVTAPVCSMTASLILSLFAHNSYAQEAAPDTVVSASRTTQAVTDALPSTTVITRADIEASSVKDVVALLSTQVGLNIRQNGGAGSMSSVSIRGGESRHTLILIDGVPMNDVALGLAPLEQIPLAMIERIEVVRGNVSAMYGSQATGGLIQIFTRIAKSGQSADISLGMGSKGQRQASAQISVGSERTQLTFGASNSAVKAMSSQNSPVVNPDIDGSRNGSVNANIRFTPTDSTELGARVIQTNSRTEYDDIWGSNTSIDYSKTRVQNVSAYLNQQWNDEVSSSFNVSQLQNKSTNFTTYPGFYNIKNQQISVQNQWNSDLGRVIVGLSHMHQTLDSGDYSDKTRNTNSAWIGYQKDLGAHHLQLNARMDHVSDLKDKQFLTGAVNYGYDMTSQWRLLAGFSNGFSAPGFDYLYYPYYNNPNLKAESANYAQLGVQWVGENMGGRATYFDTRYRNKIANAIDGPQNVERARAKGIESHIWYKMAEWNVDAGLTYQDVRNRADQTILMRQPYWTGNLSVNRAWNRWQAQLAIQARSQITDNPTYGGQASGYGVLNTSVSYQASKTVKLGLTVGNLLNRHYEPLAGYNAMPRNALFSVNYKPNW